MGAVRWLRIVLLAGALGMTGLAQSSNGYFFLAPGGVSGSGDTAATLHIGGGAEAILGKWLGAGAELGALGQTSDWGGTVMGVLSLNGYIHPASERRIDPFFTAGYSLGFRSGHINMFNVGGGANFWGPGRFGLRAEFRDHIWRHEAFPGHHVAVQYWGIRIGLAIR